MVVEVKQMLSVLAINYHNVLYNQNEINGLYSNWIIVIMQDKITMSALCNSFQPTPKLAHAINLSTLCKLWWVTPLHIGH